MKENMKAEKALYRPISKRSLWEVDFWNKFIELDINDPAVPEYLLVMILKL